MVAGSAVAPGDVRKLPAIDGVARAAVGGRKLTRLSRACRAVSSHSTVAACDTGKALAKSDRSSLSAAYTTAVFDLRSAGLHSPAIARKLGIAASDVSKALKAHRHGMRQHSVPTEVIWHTCGDSPRTGKAPGEGRTLMKIYRGHSNPFCGVDSSTMAAGILLKAITTFHHTVKLRRKYVLRI
jgi:hypothetical protein